MLVSILHRVTGSGLSVVGGIGLAWWLAAAASGEEAYGKFTAFLTEGWGMWLGLVVGIGLTWALFQHTLSGLRHFVMDIGAGFELSTNKFWANMTLVGSVLLTALLWFWIWRGAH